VVGQHGTPAPRDEQVDRLVEGRIEHVELVVHLDPQCLEGALGGMATAPASRSGDRGAHHLDEGQRGVDRARRDDGPGDPASEPLVTVSLQDVGQPVLVVGVDDLGRRQLRLGVHAHVERAVVAVAEASLGPVELGRAHTEVEEHAAHAVESLSSHDVLEMIEARLSELNPITELAQHLRGGDEGVVVLVEAEEATSAIVLQQHARMASPANRAIDHHAGRNRRQHCEHLSGEHGLVDEAVQIPRHALLLRFRASPTVEKPIAVGHRPACRRGD
jgi:hypothetical protein